MNFNDTVIIESAYGKIETVYYPKVNESSDITDLDSFLNSTPEIPSHYSAAMLTGDYKGMRREAINRLSAINELLLAVSEEHTRDIATKYGIPL
ncbi:hypothetical protein OKZ62_001901 [Vibrio navarrensis]|nr:hypothetical protein [Vibrio navarrensis]